MSGKVVKLSNRGWSAHERYLKIDQSAISYFSDVSTKALDKIQKGKQKPKQSVPLHFVTDICPLQADSAQTPNDCDEIKKFKDIYSD